MPPNEAQRVVPSPPPPPAPAPAAIAGDAAAGLIAETGPPQLGSSSAESQGHGAGVTVGLVIHRLKRIGKQLGRPRVEEELMLGRMVLSDVGRFRCCPGAARWHLRSPAASGATSGGGRHSLNGVITCPLCHERSSEACPGLMRPLTTTHAGEALDDGAVAVLRALDRAVCSDPACGGIRRIGMTTCNRCRHSTPLRPLQVGDIVPGPRGPVTQYCCLTPQPVRTCPQSWPPVPPSGNADVTRNCSAALRPRPSFDDGLRAGVDLGPRPAAEGAYRRAVLTLTGETAKLTPEDEVRWAAELAPQAPRPADARWVPQPAIAPAGGAAAQPGPGGPVSSSDPNDAASQDPLRDDHPLKGARFACLTALGPTGTRAEHAKECMGTTQRPLANRLARAMLRFQEAARDGKLGTEARWLMRNRSVFLKKKGSAKPKPVRVGEFLRATMAKKVQKKGDVFGPAASALTLGDAVGAARDELQGQAGGRIGASAVDKSFIDDGQALVRVEVAERWLRRLDQATASIGCSRDTGPNCKSVARLLCHPDRQDQLRGWEHGYIAQTCKVPDNQKGVKVLGAMVGSSEEVNHHFRSTCNKVVAQRVAIGGLEQSQCELVLHRRCLDVSKVGYILRCNGDLVNDESLAAFDASLRRGTKDALHGKLLDEGWIQATLSVGAGGLGFREAPESALPAFIASRVASRPLVAAMRVHVEEEVLGSAARCMREYDRRAHAAAQRWRGALPAGVHDAVRAHLEEAAALAERRWRPGAAAVAEAGAEDPEHPAAPRGRGALRLQRDLTRVADRTLSTGLSRARASGDADAVHRLQELCHPNQCHDWLWAISPHKGRIMTSEEFALAVRIRLGAGGPDEEVVCANCGECIIGPSGSHGLLCARGPCNAGHNAVRDDVYAFASAVDSSTELEPIGLVSSRPMLRPADVLTGVPDPSGRLAALDVGIIAPMAAGASDDCVETMVCRKQRRADGFRSELEDSGIEYRVLAVSAFGRFHDEFPRVLQSIARAHARRRGTEAHVELRHVQTRIAVSIWRRAARMARACTPLAVDEDAVDEPADAAVAERSDPPASAAWAMARSSRGGGSGGRRSRKYWMCSCGGWNWDWRTTRLGRGCAAPPRALEAAAKAKPQADKDGWVDQPRGRRAQRQARSAATSAATTKSQTSASGASGTPSGSDATAIERLQVAVEQLEALQAGPPDGVDCCFTDVVASQLEAKRAELAEAQRAAAVQKAPPMPLSAVLHKEANAISKAEKRLRAACQGLEQKQAARGIAEAQLQKAQEELAQLGAEVEEASRALHALEEEARVEAAAQLRQRAAEWAGASQVPGPLMQLDKLPEAWGSSNFEVAWAAIRFQVEAVRAQLADAPAAPRRAERRGDVDGEWPKVAQACKRELAAEAEDLTPLAARPAGRAAETARLGGKRALALGSAQAPPAPGQAATAAQDVRCGLEEARLTPHRLEEARGAVLRLGFSAFLHAPAPTDKEGPLANSGGVATLARSDLQAAESVWATPSGLRHRLVGVAVTAASGLLALACSLFLQGALGPKGINLDFFAAFGDLVLSEGRPWLAQGGFNIEPGTLHQLGWPRVQRGTYLGPAEEASALDGLGLCPRKPVWLLLQDVRPDALVQVLVRPERSPGVDAVGGDVTLLESYQTPRSVSVVGLATESFCTNGTGLAGSACATFVARLPGLAALRTASAGGRPLVGARIVVGDIAMQAVGTEQLAAARLGRAGLKVTRRLRVQHPPLSAAQPTLLASRPSLGRQRGVSRKSQAWPFRQFLQARNIGTDAANVRRGVHEGRVRAAGALRRARRQDPICKAGPTASMVCGRSVTGNADGEPRRWKLAACRSAGALHMGAERGLCLRCAELRRRRNLEYASR
ncbi:unnamed protein product [Prorocentrum cordatum]|uniref:Uncharacterized protein n=1 Tax=Prorocentrum cordatum TaxID=2364126 RepID=A0ABN9TLK7_9DINO|nr:unnamed protein product [Polarella glacialis]